LVKLKVRCAAILIYPLFSRSAPFVLVSKVSIFNNMCPDNLHQILLYILTNRTFEIL